MTNADINKLRRSLPQGNLKLTNAGLEWNALVDGQFISVPTHADVEKMEDAIWNAGARTPWWFRRRYWWINLMLLADEMIDTTGQPAARRLEVIKIQNDFAAERMEQYSKPKISKFIRSINRLVQGEPCLKTK